MRGLVSCLLSTTTAIANFMKLSHYRLMKACTSGLQRKSIHDFSFSFFLACSFATTGAHGAGMHGPKERYVLVTAINIYNLCPMHLRAIRAA